MRYLTGLNPVSKVADILPQVKRVEEVEKVAAWDAAGRVAARDVVAPHDYPPYPRAAYDGYAVSSEETPGRFKLVGAVLVGQYRRDLVLGRGEAAYVTVGAFLPEGADAVVPEEAARKEGELVAVERRFEKYANVDPPGSYVRKGTVLLRQGTVVTPFDVVGLLDVGITSLYVYRKLRLGIIATGDELVAPPIDPEVAAELVMRGRVIESTASLVSWYIQTYMPYVEVREKAVLGDRHEEVRAAVERFLQQYDAVVITGGAGPSEIDHFYKLGFGGLRGFRMKPGRPTSVAVVGGKPVFGLSGYPISALHGVVRIVEPVLRHMANVARGLGHGWHYAVITQDVQGEMAQIVRVRLEVGEGGLQATPIKTRHHSFTDPDACGVALVPPGGAKRGDVVLVLAYRDLRRG
ncbi:molybdopterin molybdotransferase MoeA [Pyrobaculum neutrophilum]|uniref:MoeA domain protein domain I and II n=1 Tax=Pyrobaculum neutrophilum (strain DSM 2338 / JCM 9278 / NBRC 100436 / V24Sta) TaxID=444157 RepID=B1YAE8_PYRNV|nr:molybdopterin molybdotransferase MoeA [Pyrobaculum neutrophilum]ACB40597.1 MoeA domain protein domain I and II [Pyrobaculum neutrophilum V24Sta]